MVGVGGSSPLGRTNICLKFNRLRSGFFVPDIPSNVCTTIVRQLASGFALQPLRFLSHPARSIGYESESCLKD